MKNAGTIETQMDKVERMQKHLPDGKIIDADTLLADLVEENDCHFSGFALDIFNIFRESSDKEAVKRMFFEFTDMELDEYLNLCFEKLS